jgi:hypothetical protein
VSLKTSNVTGSTEGLSGETVARNGGSEFTLEISVGFTIMFRNYNRGWDGSDM